MDEEPSVEIDLNGVKFVEKRIRFNMREYKYNQPSIKPGCV